MQKYLEEQLDSLDASIFTGDCLWTDFDEIYKYVLRWKKECESHKIMMDEYYKENPEEKK